MEMKEKMWKAFNKAMDENPELKVLFGDNPRRKQVAFSIYLLGRVDGSENAIKIVEGQ